VALEEAKGWAESNGLAGYAETSAKTGESVDNLFAMLSDTPANGVVQAEVGCNVIVLDDTKCC
jgi:hypothetical protein